MTEEYEPYVVLVAQNYPQGRFLIAAYPTMLKNARVVTCVGEAQGLRCEQLFVARGLMGLPAVTRLQQSMSMMREANIFPIELTVPKYWEAGLI